MNLPYRLIPHRVCLFFYTQNQCFRDTVVPVPHTLVLLTIWPIYVSSGVSSDVQMMCSDSASNPFFDLFLQIRAHFLCSGTVLSITLMELTAAAYSHSLLFLLLLTSLLWSTNNITSLPYSSPTRTLISVSHKFYCYCFWGVFLIVGHCGESQSWFITMSFWLKDSLH